MSAFYVPHLLQGRRFLVTGATGGAGSRTAIEISRCGGICTLVARNAVRAEKVLRELSGSGHGVLLPDEGGGIDCAEKAPYDGWFDAVGAEVIKPLATSFDWSDAFHANIGNAFSMLAGVGSRAKPLVKDGGSIVLMSSVAATHGQVGMSLYCAAKAAVEGLVRAAAVELAPRRIRVNAIRAGAFASGMHARICSRSTPDAVDAYARRHPMGFGRPEDISNVALFLLSDMGRWITGASWAVDGGYSAL